MKMLQTYILYCFITFLFIPTLLHSQPPSNLQWKKFADINTKRARFEAAFISRNEILIFGGYADTLNGSQIISAASVEVLNTDTRISTYIAHMIVPRSELASVVTLDSNVIAIGGTSVPLLSSTSTSLIELFDRKTRTWRSIGNLITARCQHEAILLNDHEVLVVGGRDITNSTLNSAEIFDITTGTSRLTTPFPHHINNPLTARSSIGSALVFGGRYSGASSSQSDSVYKFDRATERWIGVSKTTDAITNSGIVKLSDGSIFMSGGFNEATRSCVISIHSEFSDKFSPVGTMLKPRAWHSLIQYDSVYTIAIGGANSLAAITTHVNG